MAFKLENYMEIEVEHILPQLLRAFPDFCKCELCLLDVKALALNSLKPHYIVSAKGELYSQLEEMKIQSEADVMKALVEAIIIVRTNPRHE
jgi:competence protein ComFB